MGFGSIKYDVEKKGLDPKVAHKELAVDGTLATTLEVLQRNDSTTKEQISAQPPESATSPEDAAALVQSMFEDESVEAITAEEARLAELDKVSLEEIHAKWVAEQASDSEDIVASLPSEEAQAVLIAPSDGIEEEVSQLHNKGIPEDEAVVEDDEEESDEENHTEEEPAVETPKKTTAPKKKTATKKKTSKK